MSEKAVISYEACRHFILKFQSIAISNEMRQVLFKVLMLYLELVDESSCKFLLMNITSASGHHEGDAVLDMKFITAFSPRSQTSLISQN